MKRDSVHSRPWVRPALSIAVAALATGWAVFPAAAQPAAAVALPDAPTTRILALGHLTAKADAAAMRAVMPDEVRDTVRLYLAGKIADWYARKDKPGVVFVLELHDVGEAHAVLDALPLGKAGLMEFDLIPLGPLTPLGLLVGKP